MSDSDSEEHKEVCWSCYEKHSDDYDLVGTLREDECMNPQSLYLNDSSLHAPIQIHELGTYYVNVLCTNDKVHHLANSTEWDIIYKLTGRKETCV